MTARRLEDADRPEDVDVRVGVGMLDREADIRLRREMEHRVGPDRVEDLVGPPDVGHMQLGGSGHVLAPALREIVEDVNLVAAGEQGLDDVRADEARASGHDRPHSPIVGSACS